MLRPASRSAPAGVRSASTPEFRDFGWQLLLRALVALVAGWALAAATLGFDRLTGVRLPVPVGNARVLLGGLGTAVVTVAVFAVWMRTVVVSMSSAHVSPRLVTHYLDDAFQRGMMVAMVAAFGYVVGVAAFLPAADANGSGVPAISTVLAVLMVVGAVMTVLVAIHHAVVSLSLPALVRALSDRALAAMDLPDRPDDTVPAESSGDGRAETVTSLRMGWVQDVDYASMLAALPSGCRLTLKAAVGSFVAPGEPLAVVSRALGDEGAEAVRSAISVEATRRAELDLAFAIQQLVDVAEHATTPASNDTSTADEALVHLRAVLHELLRRGPYTGCLGGEDGRAIVSGDVWHPADHLQLTFERLRRGAATMPSTSRLMLATIAALEETARDVDDHRSLETLRDQRELLRSHAAAAAEEEAA